MRKATVNRGTSETSGGCLPSMQTVPMPTLNWSRDPDVAPGTGVTVGFVDSGIDQDHLVLDGAAIDEVFLFGKADEDGSLFSHGTSVASVAAAPRQTNLTNAPHGVAWGADMVMFAVPLSLTSPENYSPLSLSGLATAEFTWSTIIDTALGWRDGTRAVDFLNLSIGFEGIIDNYSETELRDRFGDAIEEMAQASSTEKTILVWAGGQCPRGTRAPTRLTTA